MRRLSLWTMLWILAGILCLSACDPRPVPVEDVAFLVNEKTSDSEFTPSADVQTLHFDVYCEGQWNVVQAASPAPWVQYSITKDARKDYWNIAITVTENTNNSTRQAVFVFTCGSLERRVRIIQSTEDPIFRVHTMGAYGVPGGDVFFEPGRIQFSRLLYGESSMCFRLLDPERTRVASLSGLPRQLEPGMQFPVYYRVSEEGFTRVSEHYDVLVIRVRSPYAWLKKDDSTYFVIKL